MAGLATNQELTEFSREEAVRFPLWNQQCFATDYSLYRASCASRRPRGSVENRPTGVTSKPANGVAQDVILIYPVFS
jgi:hypothetical protein